MKPGLLPALFLLALAAVPAAEAQPTQGARYLIICADDLVEAVRPLADWKTKKGMLARVVTVSEAGGTPQYVRDYVRAAWSSWPVPPEYLLIVASPAALPGYQYENESYYGDMGGDYLMELPVGRFPAWSLRECSTMVAKTLAYERHPEESDTLWYLKGTTIVVEEDSLHHDPYYQEDTRLSRQYWVDSGYVVAESLANIWGDDADDAIASVHDGRTFIGYRGVAGGGWADSFYWFWPVGWTNGRRLPIIVSATCATITVAPGEVMLGDACMRYGTPDQLGGTVAFYGTTLLGMMISAECSAGYRAFFDAIFRDGIYRLGPATLRSRARVDSLFHDYDRYFEWCLLGDPELNLWIGPPRDITVAHDTATHVGPQQFTVEVSDDFGPVPGALVCVSMDTTVYAWDTADASGSVTLDLLLERPGMLDVVVTGRNVRPYEGTCRATVSGGAYIAYLRHAVVDSPPGGNGNGGVGPGETITIPTWVRNYGDSTAAGVTGILSTDDTLATVLDSVRSFGSVPPQDSGSTGPDGFRFRVATGCPDGHNLRFTLRCTDSAGGEWNSSVNIPVGAPYLEYDTLRVLDPAGNNNGILDPCEDALLSVTLFNSGFGDATSATGILRSGDPRLTVTDSFGIWGTIPSRGRASNDDDRFAVTTGLMVPETRLPCTLLVDASGYQQTIPFSILVGRVGIRDPIPDRPAGLYWAYDDIDTLYPEHPDYDWVEIRDVGTRLDLGDNQTVTIELPPGFGPFIYYGYSYDRVSVCSNGWLAPGPTTLSRWTNRRLPDAGMPGLLAVNWDDLYPPFGGGIWYHHDAANHRFIVEWDSVHYRNPVNQFDRFEVVLYDTTLAARDGNTEFVFQYRTANSMDYNTVGIQDQQHENGICVVYDDDYDPAGAPLLPGRAIKFTTDVPVPGIAAPGPSAPARARAVGATHVRGVLDLAGTAPAELLDITGRRVAGLAPGPNDLRHLSPGIYFVRARSGPAAVTKILVVQ